MTKEVKIKYDPTPEPIIIPMNFKGMEVLGWLQSNCKILQEYSGNLFRSSVDLNNPDVLNYKIAAESAILELESDVGKIKTFLKQYEIVVK